MYFYYLGFCAAPKVKELFHPTESIFVWSEKNKYENRKAKEGLPMMSKVIKKTLFGL